MSITVILDLSVKPERMDEFKSMLAGAIPDTRAFDGCEGVTIHQDMDLENRFVLIERWASRQQRESYSAWRAQTDMGQELMAYLTDRRPTISLSDTEI